MKTLRSWTAKVVKSIGTSIGLLPNEVVKKAIETQSVANQIIKGGVEVAENTEDTTVETVEEEVTVDEVVEDVEVSEGTEVSEESETEELAKSVIIPEFKQLDNTKQIDELVKKHIESIPRQEIDLSSIDSTKNELKTILGAIEGQITTHKKELQQEIKNFDNKQSSMLGQSDKVLKKLESQVEKSEAIVRALTKFMDTVVNEVTSNVADFLTAVEVKKQEALGNDKMKNVAVDNYKQFKQFKQFKK